MSISSLQNLCKLETQLAEEGFDKKSGKVHCILECSGCLGTQMSCKKQVELDF